MIVLLETMKDPIVILFIFEDPAPGGSEVRTLLLNRKVRGSLPTPYIRQIITGIN